MTSAAPARPASPPAPPARRAGFGHVLLSEWTKIRSVRSTVWSLILLVVLTLGITVLITAITSAQWNKIGAASQTQIRLDPTNGILTQTDHVRVAVGRSYIDATPTSGTIYVGGGSEALAVDVRVEVCD